MSGDLSRESAWPTAARLLARWLDRQERIDTLLDTLPATLKGPERARCQHLVLGVVRHFGRIEAALGRLVAHPPRFATRAVMFTAGFELLEAVGTPATDGLVAKIVHHAVEQTKTLASPAEARLVNAVVRKLAAAFAIPAPSTSATPSALAEYFSHPEWLLRGWLAQFGAAPTRALLEWNQRPAPVYARWRRASDPANPPPAFLKPTAWPNFFEVPPGHWHEIDPLLKAGKLYLQDPSTRLAVELLAPQPGETILDLCAAPGGKSLLIADAMRAPSAAPVPPTPAEAAGLLVAMDLPGARIDRLKENLSRIDSVPVALVQADVALGGAAILRELQLPATYAGVLLDAPCTNTGVIRHRADVRWRLQPGDMTKHPQQQLALLHAAAQFVAPGGRLVYSTCSLEAGENENVIAEFFRSRAGGGFERDGSVVSRPWETGHDGAGAFRLRRKA
ncbi:MAG: hypothetical protein RLZZ15_2496 [Verrucomicrobiota bacterium]|jgi:16S rRNA (cytosine967-C5)-methyltransferase